MVPSDVLKVNPYGYIAWDAQGERIILQFGTTLLALRLDECKSFKQNLQRLIQYPMGSCCCEDKKCYFFKTEAHSIQIVLNAKELIELTSMLEEGLWLFDILKNATHES